jgi:hypothetical protein
MATSQNTWGSPSVPSDIKSFAGKPQEIGGDANKSPGFAEGKVATRSYGMESAGWASPNAEADAKNANTGGG